MHCAHHKAMVSLLHIADRLAARNSGRERASKDPLNFIDAALLILMSEDKRKGNKNIPPSKLRQADVNTMSGYMSKQLSQANGVHTLWAYFRSSTLSRIRIPGTNILYNISLIISQIDCLWLLCLTTTWLLANSTEPSNSLIWQDGKELVSLQQRLSCTVGLHSPLLWFPSRQLGLLINNGRGLPPGNL